MEGSSSANDRISTCSDRVDSKVELLIPSALWICSSRIPLCSFSQSSVKISDGTFERTLSDEIRNVNVLFRKRFLTSATFPDNTTCDLLIRAMLSHISSTEAILWVEKIIVCPFSFSSRISCFNLSAFTGSKPLNGSSKISNDGS